MSSDQVGGRVRALDSAEHGAVASLAGVERQAEQLVRAFDVLAVHDQRNAQVDLGEVIDTDFRGDRLTPG